MWIWYEFKKTIWSPTLTSGHVCVRVKHCFFLKRFYSIFHPRNPLNIEYQSFFESRFLDFEQLFWSCDSPLKVGPLLKIWTHLAQRTLIYWPKCPSTSLREKYPTKMKNSKTVKCIELSMQNSPRGFWISQIYQKILVANAYYNSACWNPGTGLIWFYNIYSKLSFILDIKNPIFSMRFPLEFFGRFGWFNPSGGFACWFRCT